MVSARLVCVHTPCLLTLQAEASQPGAITSLLDDMWGWLKQGLPERVRDMVRRPNWQLPGSFLAAAAAARSPSHWWTGGWAPQVSRGDLAAMAAVQQQLEQHVGRLEELMHAHDVAQEVC